MKMFSLLLFSSFCLRLADLIHCAGNLSAVTRFSVPENHGLCLPCRGSGSSDLVWTLQDRQVLVSRQGSHETSKDPQRYLLRPDGGLCVLRLDQTDAGQFHCNQCLVADVQVLTGHQYLVFEGRTLLLPCSGSSRPKQRWSRQREEGRRELLLTRFRNGTVRVEGGAEAEGGRLSVVDGALQVEDLRPDDGGEYLCNGVLQASVSVLSQATSSQTLTSWTETTSDLMKTEEVETKKNEKRPENILLLVFITALCLMIVLLAAVCVLLTGMKIRRRKRSRSEGVHRGDDTELQAWTSSPQDQTDYEVLGGVALQDHSVHYASLGRPTWRSETTRTPPDQNQHVIYSAVLPRPAAQSPVQSHQNQKDQGSTFSWRSASGV